eukprot:COSAG04_NODE_1167_length_7984_cov_8.922384_7_plen_66_part_00
MRPVMLYDRQLSQDIYMRPQAMYDRQLPAEFLEANPELASSAPNPSLPLPPLFLLPIEVLLASDF